MKRWIVGGVVAVGLLIAGSAGPGMPGSTVRVLYDNCRYEGGTEEYSRNHANVEALKMSPPVGAVLVVPKL
jgi:hypothetical protein